MNKKQIQKKEMYEATLSFLDEHASKWQAIAKLATVKNQFSAHVLTIGNIAETQGEFQVGVGKIKKQVKLTMCDKADIVNDIVEVFAIMTGNKELAELMSDSAWDLSRMKNDDCGRRVKLVITKAVENKEVLVAEYGLTEEAIVDLQADYDRFMEINGKPREYQIKKGIATQQLDELFTETTDLLNNQLDNLMKLFKRRDPNFYQGYLKARTIVDH